MQNQIKSIPVSNINGYDSQGNIITNNQLTPRLYNSYMINKEKTEFKDQQAIYMQKMQDDRHMQSSP